MSNLMTTTDNQTQKIDNISILTNGELFNRLLKISEVMANSGNFVPEHYRGKPDSCMAVVMQAARWGMDPFAVAQKTFIVGNSGVLGYEAQLVNAVINTMAPTKDRIHFEWFGAWENIVGRFVEKTSSQNKKYIAPGWNLKDEAGVGVRAWATLKGESEPRELVLMLSQAQVRNSTLWATDPRQQLAYLAVKRWARLYCPDVILGVYTADEIDEREEKVINPTQAEKITLNEITSTVGATASAQESGTNVDTAADEIRDRIDAASSVDQAKAIRADIESQKTLLGTALFTELKK
ncbi:recombinase, RecT family protein [Raoultella terrigena]|uniref:Recombinase, RecT family protein n=1 Tax=Raoultella terrigena TaxID=577 RepID=A0A7Z9CRB7_RAOTE|nr:recombinase, RecT family protein [Raoultella terrigena]